MTDLLTDDAGIVAASVVVVGLVATLVGLWYQVVSPRRAARAAVARIELARVEVAPVATFARSTEVTFMAVSSGQRPAIVDDVLIEVASSRPSPTTRTTETAAPMTVHSHRVELTPQRTSYDVRATAFGAAPAPLVVPPGDGEAFRIKLVSATPTEYRLQVVVRWIDSGRPSEAHEERSSEILVDFPVDQSDATAPSS